MSAIALNAIAWSQFRLRGGFKNMLIVGGAYALLLIGSIVLFYEVAERPFEKQNVLQGSIVIITISQMVVLLGLGCVSVSSGIRRDISTHQIESHRLMPLTPLAAAVGYLTGSTVRLAAPALVNFFVGGAVLMMQGLPAYRWGLCNALLLAMAICLWSATALTAFMSRAIFWLIVVVLTLCGCSAVTPGGFFVVVPGMLALLAPLQRGTIFDLTAAGIYANGYVVGLLGQAAIFILCLLGIARKYEHEEATAFRPLAAFILLLVWVGLSFYGIRDFARLRMQVNWFESDSWQTLLVGSLTVSLGVATLVMGSLAWAASARERRRQGGADKEPAHFWRPVLYALLSALAITALVFSLPKTYSTWTWTGTTTTRRKMIFQQHLIEPLTRDSMICIAAASFMAICGTYLLLRTLVGRVRAASWLALGAVLLLWFGPFVADGIYYGWVHPERQSALDHFSLASPIGTFASVCGAWQPNVVVGLIAQAAVVVVLAILAFAVMAKGIKMPAVPMRAPAAAME